VVVFAGQGDPRRTMALLWRALTPRAQRSAPGPKPGLSVDTIVAAAIAVADADTMDGLSMRAVGERLGRSAMALYTYVPSKRELVDLMYDQAHAEQPTAYDAGAGWRAAVTSWAADQWTLYLRHPWLLQVSYARPVLGPNEQAVVESIGRILHETGLDAGTLRRIVGSLYNLVRGAARTAAESRLAAAATGTSDQEWWIARSSLLAEVAPDFAQRFPVSTSLAQAPHPAPADDSVPYLETEAKATLDAGLTLLLDGIESTMRPPGKRRGRAAVADRAAPAITSRGGRAGRS
jgi:AcrR family transcriptional regulator